MLNSSSRVNNRYCLPIIKRTRSEVQANIESNLSKFRYFEVWLDYVEDLDSGFAASLVGLYPHRLIMIFRRQNLEPMQISSEERFKILSTLSRKQVLVDLDISVQAEEITRLQSERMSLKTILSYHNYALTPSDTELRSITDRMEGWGAHIMKIATHCSIQRDALRLLSLLIDLREDGHKSIVLGMGKHGVITRVFGTVWGNEMAFAPIEAVSKSAPGQLTVDKLDSIMQALG
ncbi:MAG: type I 3-dehydroquinate dehydratase [Proteobacteria bacterium]|jgi:3-dehydroquinate dehydratase type I|nr:type I 3-dehydroquinate dehydratase [Pseudomonadota bacterium]